MVITDQQIINFLGQYFWPFIRISGFFLVAPFIGSQLVPQQIRLMFAVLCTILIAPNIPEFIEISLFNLSSWILLSQQLLIGIAMGFLLQMIFQIFIITGQMIAMQMGLGFASMIDPTNGISVTVLSQFYLLLTTLLFLSIDGHLIVIQVLATSFYSIPIDYKNTFPVSVWSLINLIGWVFSAALLLALPMITVLLIVNITFGFMNRSAPQLNVFSLGFPMGLLVGLLLIWLSMKDFLPSFQTLFARGIFYLRDFVLI